MFEQEYFLCLNFKLFILVHIYFILKKNFKFVSKYFCRVTIKMTTISILMLMYSSSESIGIPLQKYFYTLYVRSHFKIIVFILEANKMSELVKRMGIAILYKIVKQLIESVKNFCIKMPFKTFSCKFSQLFAIR